MLLFSIIHHAFVRQSTSPWLLITVCLQRLAVITVLFLYVGFHLFFFFLLFFPDTVEIYQRLVWFSSELSISLMATFILSERCVANVPHTGALRSTPTQWVCVCVCYSHKHFVLLYLHVPSTMLFFLIFNQPGNFNKRPKSNL